MGPARFPDGMERRAAVELRAVGRTLQGYAAVFGVQAVIGSFIETIKPGAFRASLLNPALDVLALMDHDPTRLLARTSSETLRLQEDARGLAFVLDVPDTTTGRDVLALAQRGDLGGCSIGFRATDEAWPARDRRELRAVDLVEISIVQAFPAYSQTTVTARSRGALGAAAAVRARVLAML